MKRTTRTAVAVLLVAIVALVAAATTTQSREIHLGWEIEKGEARPNENTNTLYHGGVLQTTPRVYVVFWGDWSAQADAAHVRPYLVNFYRGIGGTAWNRTLTQYGRYTCRQKTPSCYVRMQDGGVLFGVGYEKRPIPRHPTVAQLEAVVADAVAYFGNRTANAQYVIALPSGHEDALSTKNGFCAWHDSALVGGSRVPYVSLPYQPDHASGCGATTEIKHPTGLDAVSLTAGHEYAEVVTDPFPAAASWGFTDHDGSEIADKCQRYGHAVQMANGTYAMQPLWSNYAFSKTGRGCVYFS